MIATGDSPPPPPYSQCVRPGERTLSSRVCNDFEQFHRKDKAVNSEDFTFVERFLNEKL